MRRREAHKLFEDREILVLHRPGASDYTLVTFADLTFRPSNDDFWGRAPADRLDLDAIGFIAKRENWFPTASVEAAAPAVRAVLKSRSIAYGYSMGGHAALKHGRRLGVGSALAVCPQVSIVPADVPWDPRYHHFHRPVVNQGMALAAEDLAPFAAVLADPYDALDWRHARMAAGLGPLHLLRAPFTGHSTIWLLADRLILDEILPRVADGDAAGIRAELRARRGRSGAWFRLMGRAACRRRHPVLSERLWRRAAELGVPAGVIELDRADSMADRAHDLLVAGRREEAIALATDLAGRADAPLAPVGRAAHILLGAGAAEAAEAAFRCAIARGAPGADLRLGLCLALAAQGRRAEAIVSARQSHAALPEDADLAATLGHLLLDGGARHLPEAEAILRATLARRPLHGQALYGLSRVLARRKDLQGAIDFGRRALIRLPGNPDVSAWFARLCLRSGDAARAARLFRRIAADHPGRPDGYVGLSEALEALGQREAAVAAVTRGLAALPGEPSLLARQKALRPSRRARIAMKLRGLLRWTGDPRAPKA